MMFGSSILKCAVRLLAVAVIFLSASPARAQPCARWEVATPNPRAGFSAVYDSLRGRTILYGGRSEEDFLVYRYEHDTWSWDGARWMRLAEAGPGERWSAGMAYDRARDRIVLFGGARDSTYFGDTWEWDGSQWSLRAVTGPAPRRAASMAYDESRGRTVLFGGVNAEGLLGDTWEWDDRAWLKLTVPGPSPRSGATAVYHAGLREVMTFGGSLGGLTRSDEFWAWNGERWRRIESAGPPARSGANLAYDRPRDRLVLQHGWVSGAQSVRTWEWDGASWMSTGLNGPSLNQGALIFDELRGRSFGFLASDVGGVFEVSAWDGTAWEYDLSMAGPRDRRAHSMVFDRIRGEPIVFSGLIYAGIAFDEVWARGEDDSWMKIPGTGPGALFDSALVYDSARSVAVLFGGRTSSGPSSSDTWEWDGAAWNRRIAASPRARDQHSMAYDSARGVTVMFGGNLSGSSDPFTWEWNGSVWSSSAAPGPSVFGPDAMAYDPIRAVTVLFGRGFGVPGEPETWTWNGSAWTRHFVAGPSARIGHAMAFVPTLGGVVLFGGSRDDSSIDEVRGDTWLWDGSAWTELEIPGPHPRYEHAMAFDERKQRLVLVGGKGSDASAYDRGDTWELAAFDTLSITRGPVPATAVSARPVSFSAEVAGGGTITYQWKKDDVALIDDGRIVGSGTSTLTIIAAQRGDAGNYTLEVTNACGHDESGPALLTITCRADLDGDGTVDFADYLVFLSVFDAQDPEADLTLDGIVDFADYLEFLNAYEEGC